MSNVDPKTKVTAAQTRKNIAAYQALTNMPDYKANNPAHSREAAEAAYQKLIAAERKAIIDKATSAASDDAVVSARRGLQDVILGVKLEAKALCGPSSDQVAALGLKKKSEKAKKSKKAKVKKAAE